MFFHNKAPRGGKEATELGPTKSGVVSGRESKLTVVTCRNNCMSSESTESTFETTESLLLSVSLWCQCLILSDLHNPKRIPVPTHSHCTH